MVCQSRSNTTLQAHRCTHSATDFCGKKECFGDSILTDFSSTLYEKSHLQIAVEKLLFTREYGDASRFDLAKQSSRRRQKKSRNAGAHVGRAVWADKQFEAI